MQIAESISSRLALGSPSRKREWGGLGLKPSYQRRRYGETFEVGRRGKVNMRSGIPVLILWQRLCRNYIRY